MRRALALGRQGIGRTSPNPAVGAVVVIQGEIVGRGWHRYAGGPHAEVEAIRSARACGYRLNRASLYVSLEPCSTHGRTPPCTDLILDSGIRRVVVGAIDPNPLHAGRGLARLREAGVEVVDGVLSRQAESLNEAFNHWIVHRTPWVTLKAAMTLDGKIATAKGESKWITGGSARRHAMGLRRAADAILVGVNTLLADDPALSVRRPDGRHDFRYSLQRIVLDTRCRTPSSAKVVLDPAGGPTLIVTGKKCSRSRNEEWPEHVEFLRLHAASGKIRLPELMDYLGRRGVLNLLVEGGGEVHASFLESGLAHRIAFYYAPKILGGFHSRKAVAGTGARSVQDLIRLENLRFRRLGPDLLLTATLPPRHR